MLPTCPYHMEYALELRSTHTAPHQEPLCRSQRLHRAAPLQQCLWQAAVRPWVAVPLVNTTADAPIRTVSLVHWVRRRLEADVAAEPDFGRVGTSVDGRAVEREHAEQHLS
jgi:hypothetical protein